MFFIVGKSSFVTNIVIYRLVVFQRLYICSEQRHSDIHNKASTFLVKIYKICLLLSHKVEILKL